MRLVVASTLLVLAATGLVALEAGATASAKPIPAREVQLKLVGRFNFPDYVVSPPGDPRRLFVVEKAGSIRLLLDGRKLKTPFLEIAAQVATGNEPGLLSMAFSPGYARNGLFYVYFAGTDRRTHLLEFRRSASNPNKADPTSRRQVLSFEHLSGEHFGGLLLFGPDGKLYLSTGDGGLNEWQDKMRAQRLDDPNGKILHVDPRTGAARVVARGLRNPWRYTIDSKTGDLYVGDAGEFVRESIKYASAAQIQGTNFGWPCYEGNLPSTKFPAGMCPGRKAPLYEYAREGGNCSVIAGVAVRDPRLSRLAGRFLYTDYCLGEVIVLNVRKGRLATKRSLRIYQPGVTSFGTDAQHRIYVTTAGGKVYRLDPRAKQGSPGGGGASTGKELFLASGCGTCHSLKAATPAAPTAPTSTLQRPLVLARSNA